MLSLLWGRYLGFAMYSGDRLEELGIATKLAQWGWVAMATGLGFFLKSFHNDVKENNRKLESEIQKVKDDHADHKLHVAQTYLTNARADRMEEKIDKIYEAVVNK